MSHEHVCCWRVDEVLQGKYPHEFIESCKCGLSQRVIMTYLYDAQEWKKKIIEVYDGRRDSDPNSPVPAEDK